MTTNYQMIMDASTMMFAWIGYGLHLIFIAFQVALTAYLILSGVLTIVLDETNKLLLKRLGWITNIPERRKTLVGILEIMLGLLLVFPFVAGLHWLISGSGSILAIVFIIYFERTPNQEKHHGLVMRYLFMMIALMSGAMIFFNQGDNIVLGVNILLKARNYQRIELAWQNESDLQSPKVGDVAPDFVLTSADGVQTVRLSEFINDKPVALIFGAHSCPPFSEETVGLLELYEKYNNEVDFLFIYGSEPHPIEEWWLGESRVFQLAHAWLGSRGAIDISIPITQEERNAIALRAQEELFENRVDFYVDTIDNHVTNLYTSQPTRFYLLDQDGVVVYNPGTGPYSFNAAVFEEFIADYVAGITIQS